MRWLGCLLALSIGLALAPPARADEAAAVRAELEREVAAWNRGDLDGYLSGYERAPTTIMIGRDRLYRGWDDIAAHYRQSYAPSDKATGRMGRLAFAQLEVQLIAADWAVAVGRWQLARSAAEGGPAAGWFTLTLHKGRDGWRIVLDHTS
jgi:ketosteroid isomerase-like protein